MRSINRANPAPAPLASARRGSTIIVAVGVLAVLALVAISYAVAVRTDRAGVTAYEGGVDLESSSQIVRDEIGTILVADIFGNKIVTPDIPIESGYGGGTIRVWPRMFEDGEYFDTPRTAPGTFDQRNPDQQAGAIPSINDPWVIAPQSGPAAGVPAYFPSAPNRDDAWLSNTEPFNRFARSPRDGFAHLQWTSWGQFSNLRSAYRWVRTSPNDRVGLWVRDDGRFADLGQFFLSDDAVNPLRLRGDPGANLSFADSTNGRDDFTGLLNGPEVALGTTLTSGGPVNFATDIFEWQLQRLGELHSVGDFNFPELNPYDERFFTDTDGDYRADARWQEIPALDGLFGMRWVVAAKIIDNSSMVNVNTAMEFQDPLPANTDRVGDGRTPADVDLTRLVRSAHLAPDLRSSSLWASGDPNVFLQIVEPTSVQSQYSVSRMDNLFNPINQHLVEQLGFDRFTTTLVNAARTPSELVWSRTSGGAADVFQPADILGGTGNPPDLTTRLHRYMANRYYGVSPLQPVTEQINPYEITAEADLRAFFGVNNNSIISKVEQRFDFGYLDVATGTLSGPMRTKEGIDQPARQYAVDPSAPGAVRPSVLAIATDTRRHLTTVSGAGDFSPVPVLNRERVNENLLFDRAYSTRINFHDIPRASPNPAEAADASLAARYLRVRSERHDTVRESFGAFAWALAPLAGHSPLMSPLNETHTGWSLAAANTADSSKFFYGGDAQPMLGPAYMTSQAPGVAGVDPGASYAILRAASLAVNLADATDDDRIDPFASPQNRNAPTGATRDLPTVARLYNIPHPSPYEIEPGPNAQATGLPPLPTLPNPPTGPITDSVVRMGVSFPWGDLRDPTGTSIDTRLPASNTVLLPEEYVGNPIHGVTLAGLDRQPFLREIATVAIYADSLALINNPSVTQINAADEAIDPTDPDERIGSIIAWEVGNPWPQSIDISGYRLALALDDNELLTFDWSTATPVIQPGERVIFYAVHWADDATLGEEALMAAFEAQWRAEVEDQSGLDEMNVRRVAPDDERCLRDIDLALVDDPIPFQDWGVGNAVGIIYVDGDDGVPAGPIPGAGRILVDRISGDGDNLPIVLVNAYPLTPAPDNPPNRKRTGVMTMTGSLSRTTESQNEGFPAWVIERPSANVFIRNTPGETFTEWIVAPGGAAGFQPEPGDIASTQGPEAAQITATLGAEDKGAFPIAIPSFQLFVPNTELRYTSELLQISAFTHMYVHADVDPLGATLGASIADSAQAGPGAWRTVSEQLGSDGEIYRDAPGTARTNPYLGVLDPTRFVLASGSAPARDGVLGPIPAAFNSGLPEALAIPLALRALDCFEPLWTPDWRGGSRLIQGRININTAAQKALRMLPLLDPFAPIGPLRPQSTPASGDWRVPLIMAYRDRIGTNSADIPSTPADITELMGLNTASNSPLRVANNQVEFGSFSSANTPLNTGFVTAGELAILDRWNSSGNGNYNPLFYDGAAFGELGSNTLNDSASDLPVPALDVRRDDNIGIDNTFVRATPMLGGSFADFEGADDPEERLAIYRAVSNIVTSRSDVYTAYFKVRGYTPADIEAVTIIDSPTDQNVADAMNDLSPRFEARYLAVYDRSNVRTPVDRPRVLLFVRLPD